MLSKTCNSLHVYLARALLKGMNKNVSLRVFVRILMTCVLNSFVPAEWVARFLVAGAWRSH